jgi:adenylylsulfate kinase
MENIFPNFNKLVNKEFKEEFLRQRSKVIWMVGLSGAGKSTIALSLERALFENNYFTMLLDGDNIRFGLNNNLGFTEEDRFENIRRVAEVAKLFMNCGVITICSFISPKQKMRNVAKEIIGADNFLEIFVNSSIEVCEQRDVKGLYEKVRKGEIKNFTGKDAVFEAPENPSLELRTDKEPIEESLMKLYNFLEPQIRY